MIERRSITQPSGLTVTSGGLQRAGQEVLDAKQRRVGLVPASPFGNTTPAVTSGASFSAAERPPSPHGMTAASRPFTRARSKSRASSDDAIMDAETSATDTGFMQTTRSDDERSSGRDGGAAEEPQQAPAQEAAGTHDMRRQLKRAVSNEESGSGPRREPCEAAEALIRSLSAMEHTNAALEAKIGQTEEENRTLQVVLASTQQQWKDTLSVNARLLAEQQQRLEDQRPTRATRANKRQRTMASQPEATAATWRPQLSAASYPSSGSTITTSYPGSLQAIAGNPILHMACVLPRIDTGAYSAPRIPALPATTHSRHKQPGAAMSATGPSLRSHSQTANNNADIGGASGGFFSEAEAALFEAALDAELSGLEDFSTESGCGDPLAALLAGTDSMMLPDAWL